MTSCCQQHPMPWSGATGAIARCKRVSTGCGRKRRSVRALHWICGVKPKPKAVNKPLQHSIVHGLAKPGVFTTVSNNLEVMLLVQPIAHVSPVNAHFERAVRQRQVIPLAGIPLDTTRLFLT